MSGMKLPQITIEVNGIEYDHTFSDDIRIDKTNLDEELTTQAERYSFYAFLHAEAEYLFETAEHELDQIYARLDAEKRAAADNVKTQNPGFKYTEKMCENEVITDPRYVTQQAKVRKARLMADQLKVCSNAFAQRREMLISLSTSHRNQLMPHRVMEEKQAVVHQLMSESAAHRAVSPPPPTLPTPGVPVRRRQPRSVTANPPTT